MLTNNNLKGKSAVLSVNDINNWLLNEDQFGVQKPLELEYWEQEMFFQGININNFFETNYFWNAYLKPRLLAKVTISQRTNIFKLLEELIGKSGILNKNGKINTNKQLSRTFQFRDKNNIITTKKIIYSFENGSLEFNKRYRRYLEEIYYDLIYKKNTETSLNYPNTIIGETYGTLIFFNHVLLKAASVGATHVRFIALQNSQRYGYDWGFQIVKDNPSKREGLFFDVSTGIFDWRRIISNKSIIWDYADLIDSEQKTTKSLGTHFRSALSTKDKSLSYPEGEKVLTLMDVFAIIMRLHTLENQFENFKTSNLYSKNQLTNLENQLNALSALTSLQRKPFLVELINKHNFRNRLYSQSTDRTIIFNIKYKEYTSNRINEKTTTIKVNTVYEVMDNKKNYLRIRSIKRNLLVFANSKFTELTKGIIFQPMIFDSKLNRWLSAGTTSIYDEKMNLVVETTPYHTVICEWKNAIRKLVKEKRSRLKTNKLIDGTQGVKVKPKSGKLMIYLPLFDTDLPNGHLLPPEKHTYLLLTTSLSPTDTEFGNAIYGSFYQQFLNNNGAVDPNTLRYFTSFNNPLNQLKKELLYLNFYNIKENAMQSSLRLRIDAVPLLQDFTKFPIVLESKKTVISHLKERRPLEVIHELICSSLMFDATIDVSQYMSYTNQLGKTTKKWARAFNVGTSFLSRKTSFTERYDILIKTAYEGMELTCVDRFRPITFKKRTKIVDQLLKHLSNIENKNQLLDYIPYFIQGISKTQKMPTADESKIIQCSSKGSIQTTISQKHMRIFWQKLRKEYADLVGYDNFLIDLVEQNELMYYLYRDTEFSVEINSQKIPIRGEDYLKTKAYGLQYLANIEEIETVLDRKKSNWTKKFTKKWNPSTIGFYLEILQNNQGKYTKAFERMRKKGLIPLDCENLRSLMKKWNTSSQYVKRQLPKLPTFKSRSKTKFLDFFTKTRNFRTVDKTWNDYSGDDLFHFFDFLTKLSIGHYSDFIRLTQTAFYYKEMLKMKKSDFALNYLFGLIGLFSVQRDWIKKGLAPAEPEKLGEMLAVLSEPPHLPVSYFVRSGQAHRRVTSYADEVDIKQITGPMDIGTVIKIDTSHTSGSSLPKSYIKNSVDKMMIKIGTGNNSKMMKMFDQNTEFSRVFLMGVFLAKKASQSYNKPSIDRISKYAGLNPLLGTQFYFPTNGYLFDIKSRELSTKEQTATTLGLHSPIKSNKQFNSPWFTGGRSNDLKIAKDKKSIEPWLEIHKIILKLLIKINKKITLAEILEEAEKIVIKKQEKLELVFNTRHLKKPIKTNLTNYVPQLVKGLIHIMISSKKIAIKG
ncbi:MAG: hypothetical protein ACTSYA_05585 [Candidatus Kariarchaeaceae archaeon]